MFNRKTAYLLTAIVALSALLIPGASGSVLKVAVAEDFDGTW